MDTHKINIEKNLRQLEGFNAELSTLLNKYGESLYILNDKNLSLNKKKNDLIEQLEQISNHADQYITMIIAEQANFVAKIEAERKKHETSWLGWLGWIEFPKQISDYAKTMLASKTEFNKGVLDLISELKQPSIQPSHGGSRRRKNKRSNKRSHRKQLF